MMRDCTNPGCVKCFKDLDVYRDIREELDATCREWRGQSVEVMDTVEPLWDLIDVVKWLRFRDPLRVVERMRHPEEWDAILVDHPDGPRMVPCLTWKGIIEAILTCDTEKAVKIRRRIFREKLRRADLHDTSLVGIQHARRTCGIKERRYGWRQRIEDHKAYLAHMLEVLGEEEYAKLFPPRYR